MRIWDIDPGYLNRQSLLGEHRELHGMVSIFVNRKEGYSRHPETKRWEGYGWALKYRHRQLSCEMALRGYIDRSPVRTRSSPGLWPDNYIDSPAEQYRILEKKYADREPGRISLPKSVEQLWNQHKYSILARDPELYKEIGSNVAVTNVQFEDLSELLVEKLRDIPEPGTTRNAVLHMWDYVSGPEGDKRILPDSLTTLKLLSIVQQRSMKRNVSYLINSTALSELMVWLPNR